jgi:hypothetical protein
LGGAYSVLVTDASALWYNPANLGRVEKTELQAEFVRDETEGTSRTLTGAPDAPPPVVTTASSSLTKTRLGAGYLAIPLSGRSTWALGFGTALTHHLDRALAADLTYAPGDFVDTLNPDPNSFVAEEIEQYSYSDDQRGAVWAWQFGVGGSISPSVYVGAAGTYYDGYLEFNNRTRFSGTRYEDTVSGTPGVPVRWDITTTSTEDLHGWGATGGVFVRTANNLGFSAVVRSPVTYTIDNDQLITEQRDLGAVVETFPPPTTRWLKTPLQATFGAAGRWQAVAVAIDVTFTDWSQSEYKDSPYISQYNDLLRMTYREELAWALGAEFSPGRKTVALRGGLRVADLAYDPTYTVDEHLTLSGGAGFWLDRVLLLDLAASLDTWRGRNPLYGFDEDYERVRFLVTTSYRFN